MAVTINDTFTTWASRSTFPNGQNASGRIRMRTRGTIFRNTRFSATLEWAIRRHRRFSKEASERRPKYLTLTFPARKFTQGLTYAVEANDGLSGPWTEIWKSADGFHTRKL